jgi:hypothetical protein
MNSIKKKSIFFNFLPLVIWNIQKDAFTYNFRFKGRKSKFDFWLFKVVLGFYWPIFRYSEFSEAVSLRSKKITLHSNFKFLRNLRFFLNKKKVFGLLPERNLFTIFLVYWFKKAKQLWLLIKKKKKQTKFSD